MIEQFKKDVEQGLSQNPKSLSSKYFYDAIGDELFVDIMNMPEYYLTDAELEIFRDKTKELIKHFSIDENTHFQLIELGAGDGFKTKELLKELVQKEFKFDYLPIDISDHTLEKLETTLNSEIPKLSVKTQQGDYFQVLASLKDPKQRRIVLFLGSSIGNLTDDLSTKFLSELSDNLSPGDRLLLGVDLIKEERIVLPAYNDAKGITSKFNLNLLHRINNELKADFDLDSFAHKPEYDQNEGIARSFLTSLKKQTVHIASINKSFQFEENEKIQTEISRKYNDKIIAEITSRTNFFLEQKIMDSKEYFADYMLLRK